MSSYHRSISTRSPLHQTPREEEQLNPWNFHNSVTSDSEVNSSVEQDNDDPWNISMTPVKPANASFASQIIHSATNTPSSSGPEVSIVDGREDGEKCESHQELINDIPPSATTPGRRLNTISTDEDFRTLELRFTTDDELDRSATSRRVPTSFSANVPTAHSSEALAPHDDWFRQPPPNTQSTENGSLNNSRQPLEQQQEADLVEEGRIFSPQSTRHNNSGGTSEGKTLAPFSETRNTPFEPVVKENGSEDVRAKGTGPSHFHFNTSDRPTPKKGGSIEFSSDLARTRGYQFDEYDPRLASTVSTSVHSFALKGEAKKLPSSSDTMTEDPSNDIAREIVTTGSSSTSKNESTNDDRKEDGLSTASSSSSQEGGPMWNAARKLAQTVEDAWAQEKKNHSLHASCNGNLISHASSEQYPEAWSQHDVFHGIRRTSPLPLRKKKAKISQSLMARTRSRVDVDSPVPPRSPVLPRSPVMPTSLNSSLFRSVIAEENNGEGNNQASGGRAMQRGDNDDNVSAILVSPKIAKKRTRVVQLLLYGLLGIVGGFFGSLYTQTSCHFASADIDVNDDSQQSFKIHFGMWKYSPIDSVFQGYSYCYHYDDTFTDNAPEAARWAGLVGLTCGAVSLCVLWVYLILGSTSLHAWKTAVCLLLFAGIFQALTFLFFDSNVCRRNACALGPSSYTSMVSCIVWFLLAFEMHFNAPMLAMIPSSVVAASSAQKLNVELSEMHHRRVDSSGWTFLPFKSTRKDVPSLSTIAKHSQQIHTKKTRDGSRYMPPSV